MQLNEHLAINNIHDKFQSAYRPGFSTETALIRITDDILFALDNQCCTALIMIDMSAAFDTIDHNILLHRLPHHFGINNSVLSWFRSYLNNRSHCVNVNNNISRSFQLFSGVPQGSVLAPILFALYIKPLTSIISKFGFSYHFYADDVQFYVTFDADKTLDANVLTKCLKAVEQWLCCNKLKLNNSKTQCILFGRSCKQSSSVANAFNTVDFPLTSSICVKNLGVLLDSNLFMEGQMKSIITRGGVKDIRLEAKAKDTKKNPRPRSRTAFPRTDTLEAKDRNARGQGQGPRTQAQVLSKKRKKRKGLHKNFSGDLQKKSLHRNFSSDLHKKNVFQIIFQALHKILTIKK